MTWSVSRVRAKPTPGGGLEVDVAFRTASAEASVLTLKLSSRATDEVRALLGEMLPRT